MQKHALHKGINRAVARGEQGRVSFKICAPPPPMLRNLSEQNLYLFPEGNFLLFYCVRGANLHTVNVRNPNVFRFQTGPHRSVQI